MAGRSDKVKEDMDTIVSEPRVTLDSGLFGKNVIKLSLEEANDLSEAKSVSLVQHHIVRLL